MYTVISLQKKKWKSYKWFWVYIMLKFLPNIPK
jgi:hypothetical protein